MCGNVGIHVTPRLPTVRFKIPTRALQLVGRGLANLLHPTTDGILTRLTKLANVN